MFSLLKNPLRSPRPFSMDHHPLLTGAYSGFYPIKPIRNILEKLFLDPGTDVFYGVTSWKVWRDFNGLRGPVMMVSRYGKQAHPYCITWKNTYWMRRKHD